MKNIKIILAYVPVFIFAAFIYFFADANSTEKPQPSEKPQSMENSRTEWCNYSVILTSSSGTGCTGSNFTYCINGGTAMSGSGGAFSVSLPCGETSVICVQTTSGCWGRLFVTPPCPCPALEYPLYLNIEKSDRACTCM